MVGEVYNQIKALKFSPLMPERFPEALSPSGLLDERDCPKRQTF
jgi:hypothetical protein